MLTPEIIRDEFAKIFSVMPTLIARAPGRVNLIGEHTDYNDGFVLPIAIDRAVWMAARPRADCTLRISARDFGNAVSEFALEAPVQLDTTQTWSNYVRGVAWALQKRGIVLSGADVVLQGDVPLGSGLSSSAALEVCTATLLTALAQIEISSVEIARLCQQAENDFVGVKCGIMDQFASALAQQDHALLVDCRDLAYRNVALPSGATFVVCDTLKRRGLVDSEYNTRRAECAQAAQAFGVQALREVSLAECAQREKELPRVVAQRARHVITENARVLAAVSAAESNDLATFGALMNESHTSLRDAYQVSCAELDTLVEIARAQPGCLGARLTGAGFGGCTVNLVLNDAVNVFVVNVAREYQARTGLMPPIYPCRAVRGATCTQLNF